MILIYNDPISGRQQAITFDATVKESHSGDTQITDHPVELGANISDHIRPLPAELKIQGIVTDRPLIPPTPAVNNAPPPLQYYAGRAAQQYALLENLRDTGVLLEVFTDTKQYRNMLIKRVTTDVDKNTNQALYFQMELKQIRVVNSQTIVLQKTKVNKAKPKVDAGKQANQEAQPQVQAETYLHGLGSSEPVQFGAQTSGNAILKVLQPFTPGT